MRPGTETRLQHTNQQQTATPCGQSCAIAKATLTLLYFTTLDNYTLQQTNCVCKILKFVLIYESSALSKSHLISSVIRAGSMHETTLAILV